MNAWHETVSVPIRPSHAGYPYSYDLGKQLNALSAKAGDYTFNAFWAGQGVNRVREMDAPQLMQALIKELG